MHSSFYEQFVGLASIPLSILIFIVIPVCVYKFGVKRIFDKFQISSRGRFLLVSVGIVTCLGLFGYWANDILALLPVFPFTLPWILLYFLLPKIPGVTSGEAPAFALLPIIAILIPAYLNCYIASRILYRNG